MSRIAEKIDNHQHVAAYSCDLSAAFDMLNKDTFAQRLLQRNFPKHLRDLVYDFLSDREAYVTVEDTNSMIRDLRLGCVQGSILGPIIFTLMMSPIHEVVNSEISTYADDSLNVISSDSDGSVSQLLEKTLRKHIKWLKDSGFVVNDSKTEIILFSRNVYKTITVNIGNEALLSKRSIKFLGISIDYKLEWDEQIKCVTNKCKKILYGIKQLRKATKDNEKLKQVMISIFYSRLLYACEIWLNKATSKRLVKTIEVVHRSALRVFLSDWKFELSRAELEAESPFAAPLAWSNYCLSKLLFNITHEHDPNDIWCQILALNSINGRSPYRPTLFRNNNTKFGLKSIYNQLALISRDMCFDWFDNNLDKTSFAKLARRSFVYKKNDHS